MRFLHTGDWHLGRLFHGTQLTEDQRHVLDQIVQLAADARPDVVLVAGDVYDRAVPPPEAVELLDEVLSRLVLDLKLPVVLIAGNHDSPGRLHFGSRLLAGRRLYVTGNLPARCEPLVLSDGDGPVHFYAVPYAEPATVRACLKCEDAGEIPDHNAAMRRVLDGVRASHPPGARSVVVAHAFVAGGSGSESERPLSVGGAGTVEADCFAGFHYAALGHLHRPQAVGAEHVRYCGSILKYSFDESAGDKCALVVELDGAGACRCEAVALKPRHDVRRIEGALADLLAAPDDGGAEDYLEVMLLDPGPVPDAIGRLRERYPNVMSIRRPEAPPPGAGAADGGRPGAKSRVLDDAVLFRSFFAHVCGTEPTAEQQVAYAEVVEEMHRRERVEDSGISSLSPVLGGEGRGEGHRGKS